MTEPDMRATVTPHHVRRLHIPLPGSYLDVRRRYESLVPVVDTAVFARAKSWSDVVELAKQLAPLGFMRYFSTDVAAAMAGSATQIPPACEYLMGNHTIAERMYRHNPAVMLHAPLRVLILQMATTPAATTALLLDQPSGLFASYGIPAVTEVGEYLDQLVAGLVERLGGDPSVLRS